MQRAQYYCTKCGKKLEGKPPRYVKQINDQKETYNAYHNSSYIYLCKKHRAILQAWLERKEDSHER